MNLSSVLELKKRNVIVQDDELALMIENYLEDREIGLAGFYWEVV